jgi:hypothetical protein
MDAAHGVSPPHLHVSLQDQNLESGSGKRIKILLLLPTTPASRSQPQWHSSQPTGPEYSQQCQLVGIGNTACFGCLQIRYQLTFFQRHQSDVSSKYIISPYHGAGVRRCQIVKARKERAPVRIQTSPKKTTSEGLEPKRAPVPATGVSKWLEAPW